MDETIETVCQWADETFGPATYDAIINRIYDEWQKFDLAITQEDVLDEAADMVITLYRLPGIREAINKKMHKNRYEREWVP